MASEENKALVRRYFEEIFNNHNMAVIDEIFSSDYVNHEKYDPDREEIIRGQKGLKDAVSAFLSALPDLQCAIDDAVAEGDKVVTRWTTRGTHKGSVMGIAPTNKQITVTGITIDRIADGRIVETWTTWDLMSLYQQLGVLPSDFKAAA